MLAAGILLAGMAAGCGNSKNKEDQEAYRQIGINNLEQGKYDNAVRMRSRRRWISRLRRSARRNSISAITRHRRSIWQETPREHLRRIRR